MHLFTFELYDLYQIIIKIRIPKCNYARFRKKFSGKYNIQERIRNIIIFFIIRYVDIDFIYFASVICAQNTLIIECLATN